MFNNCDKLMQNKLIITLVVLVILALAKYLGYDVTWVLQYMPRVTNGE